MAQRYVTRSVCRALALAFALLVAGCALYPPADGVNHSAGGGLGEIMQRYDIRPLDPQSKIPLTTQAAEELEKTDPSRTYRGTTYRLTHGNRLPRDWIVQTPNAWGKTAAEVQSFPLDCTNCDPDFKLPVCRLPRDCAGGRCVPLAASVAVPGAFPRKFCVGHSDELVDVPYKLVVSARRAVDIALLQPPADGRFLAALRNGVTWLAHAGRAVTIRVVVGDYPPDGVDAEALLGQLARDAKAVPNSRLSLHVAAFRSCDVGATCHGPVWNHAKIVAVDGKRAMVGGHNMWSGDYLADAPVHDLSMLVEGPAAHDAHRFADALWGAVCGTPPKDKVNAHFALVGARGAADDRCPAKIALGDDDDADAAGGVAILSVGRLASGIAPAFADQSLVARDLMFGAATRTIRLVQQDVAFAFLPVVDRAWPDSALDALAELIAAKQGDVYLVLSNPGAKGPVGSYSNGVTLEDVAQKIKTVVAQRSGIAEPQLSTLLCQRLHLAPLRFGPDASWPQDKPIGTHAKFWMIDDRVFYIGSENLYPTDLQEFGYIVEDPAAAAQLRAAYWDDAWKWSRPAAISGSDAPRCVFTDHPTG